MWSPDQLPRAKTVTFFNNGAGQTPPAVGQRPSEVAPPPSGKSHNLIIHLDLVEDWSPPRERTPSSGQSGVPSPVSSEPEDCPRIYNFDDWTPGVLDGMRTRHTRAQACRPPPGGHHVERHDDDEDDGGPRRHSQSLLERGKQAFSLLRCTGEPSTARGSNVSRE